MDNIKFCTLSTIVVLFVIDVLLGSIFSDRLAFVAYSFLQRLSDYFRHFLVDLVSMALVGFAAKYWARIVDVLLSHEGLLSKVFRVLIFFVVPGAVFLGGGWQIASSIAAASVFLFSAMLAMMSAQRNSAVPSATLPQRKDEINRFRWASLILLFGLSWLVAEFGRIGGNMLVVGPKRVYLLKLQDQKELYANIVLFTSGGLIYRIGGDILFSPNDSVVLVRRTSMRRQM